jgi:hypothetical protein
VAFGLTVAFATAAAAIGIARYDAFAARGLVAIDYRMFVEFGHRWATTGSIYAPYQLIGPFRYDVAAGTTNVAAMPALYPPLVGPVFWLLGLLPAFLWWAVPVVVLAVSVRGARAWTWPLLAAVACLPQVPSLFIVGGSSMWVLAGLALGVREGWPVLVVALKPTLAPFALVGVRHRSTWIGAGLLLAVSLLMLPEWLRYVTVIRNLESPSLAYSFGDLPPVAAVLLAVWSAVWRRSSHESKPTLGILGRP